MLPDICNLPNPASPFNRHPQNWHKSRDPALNISLSRPSEQGRISNRSLATGTVTAQARPCGCVRNRQHQRVETRSDVFGADGHEPCLSAGFFCDSRSRTSTTSPIRPMDQQRDEDLGHQLRLLRCGFGGFTASTTFRAIFHVVPDVFPLLTPLERPSAHRTDLAGTIARSCHRLIKNIGW